MKIPKEYLGNERSEHEFLVHKNDFIHGVLDKNQFVKYGLVHTVHELYGPGSAGALLSAFSRLFTVFLQVCQPSYFPGRLLNFYTLSFLLTITLRFYACLDSWIYLWSG